MSNLDPDPMPVFLIKAKDNLAIETIIVYQRLCLKYGLMDQATEVDKALAEVQAWRRRNPDAGKWPDHIHVPAR